MNKTSGVSIILAVWNQLCYTKLAVDSILKNTDSPFELIVVDNGSKPNIKNYFDSLKGAVDMKYVRNETNLGPIKAISQGIKAAKYGYIMVIHNDVIILENGWLNKITSLMDSDPNIGIVGLAGRQEIYKTGCVNEASLKHSLQNEDLNAPMTEEVAGVAVVDGLCFVMTRAFLEKVKGFDETYGYMHFYDLDISLQSLEAGFRNKVVRVEALHLGNGGMTRKLQAYKEIVKDDYGLWKRNRNIFARKWARLLPVKVN